MIKMVNLYSQYVEIQDSLDQSFSKIISESSFIRGEDIFLLENELADFLGVKHCITCASGTDALTISLMAIGLERGDEVIVPAFSFAATAEAVALLGGIPVFADVDPETFNINTKSAERLINDRTKAIIPVHLFGQPCNMNQLVRIAKKYGLKIIEDNAQSLGSVCRIGQNFERYTGTIGDIGCTSFFPTKPLGTFGDGGAMFTDDDYMAERIRLIANHGQPTKYQHQIIGVNSRLDTIQAAVLRAKLPRLNDWNDARRNAAAYYTQQLSCLNGIELPQETDFGTHIYHQYTIKVARELRNPLQTFLNQSHISSMVYYPSPLYSQPAFCNISKRDYDTSCAEDLSKTVLSLPIHSHISTGTQDKVIAAVCDFFSNL